VNLRQAPTSFTKLRLRAMLWHVNKKPEILFSDGFLLAVNKPAGMLSIPDRYDPDAPVILSLLEKAYGKLYVVHRIDKDTSGVLLFARDQETHKALNALFHSRAIEKSYLALVRGRTEEDEWACDLPLLADADKLHRSIVDKRRGKECFSRFETVERYEEYSLVRVKPETGRTHQVRVHCAASGYPIVADPLYGDGKSLFLSKIKRGWRGDSFEERPLLARTGLHAETLKLTHPDNGSELALTAPLPKDMKAAIAQLKKLTSL
jgi:pseudouridine synthase, RluA family